MTDLLQIAPEVSAALIAGTPVVALESTIISHGFPYPANLECALECERIAREEGAVPATVAIIGGVIRAGLSRAEIEHLATTAGIPKASRRDLATLVAGGSDGATTVAATMMVAEMAGIRVFATGGIGGVHRGAEASFDISADLEELARTDVAVVCAGAKSVLDLGLTLEYLETHGVPVLGYGTDGFPAFYTRTSGFGVDARFDSPADIAAVLRSRRELGISGGVIVANPIPAEHELSHAEIDGVIETALAEATEQGVRGKEVTPFLLGRIHALTGGRSEAANKELVYNNVRLAARIAGALSEGSR
ncbi:MAG: pseudouridine-5-phosphate glycosidase [Actinobacteria bacterium HGW-Actinobacteria-6]|nr:MAG: pseudouridine-5-phosphate glycosidase [Actinobacteria bacterium HGW-Actinobacteria-6]